MGLYTDWPVIVILLEQCGTGHFDMTFASHGESPVSMCSVTKSGLEIFRFFDSICIEDLMNLNIDPISRREY